MLSIGQLKELLKERYFQIEIARWIEANLRPLADPRKYEALCTMEPYMPTPQELENIYIMLKEDVGHGEPGHDLGHSSRDALAVAALIGTDPVINTAHQNDVVAGFLAGIYHDIGNSIWPRYEDTKWECGHAEIGAWRFYERTDGLLPPHIRLLVAYNIACHTHMLNPVDIAKPAGGHRMPWTDHLSYNIERPIRVGVWVTRFADRLDTNGVTLFARHIPASIMGSFYGGRDFTAGEFYELNGEALTAMLMPEVKVIETSKGAKSPTTLQHISNFANSNFRNPTTNLPSAYSQHDDTFPAMKKLISYKANQGLELARIVSESKPVRNDSSITTHDLFWDILCRVACTPAIQETQVVFDNIWMNLTKGEQEKWRPGIVFANHAYDNWLNMLIQSIESSNVELVKNFSVSILPDIKSTLGI